LSVANIKLRIPYYLDIEQSEARTRCSEETTKDREDYQSSGHAERESRHVEMEDKKTNRKGRRGYF